MVKIIEFDVIVIGSGPAGSAAALRAAKKGSKVLVLERGPEPGSKNVSGAMIRLSSIARVFDINNIPIERKVKDLKLIAKSETGKISIDIEIKEDLANVGRLKLDKWMSQQAESAGAIILTKTTAQKLEWQGNNAVSVKTDRGEVKGKAFVLAEGVNALISMDSGLRRDFSPEGSVQAVKEVYSLNKDEVNRRFSLGSDSDGISWRILINSPFIGAGFLYTYRDAISIGLGIPMNYMIRNKIRPNEALERFKELIGLNELVKGGSLREYSAKVIPEEGFPNWKACKGNVYMAGDTIGLVDALNFNGIGPAIASGAIAGEMASEVKQCSEYEEGLMRDSEVIKVIKDKALVKELLKEENFNFYISLITEGLTSWAYGDLSKLKETVFPNTLKILKHGLLLLRAIR